MSPTPASPEATEGQLKPLPCPFCGKAPHSAWHDAGAPGMEDCGFWGIDCCHAFSHEDSEDEAVAAWNTRARSAHADIEAGDAVAWRAFNPSSRYYAVTTDIETVTKWRALSYEKIEPLFAHPSPPIDGDREAVSSLRNMGVLDPSPPIDGLVAFLNQAARYFENRPTGGEDSAHWANVYNTENARKAAAALSRLDGLVERNPTEHEEWLTRQSTLDRHRVLVLEKRLAASDAAVLALTTALLRAREELEQWFDAAEVLKIIDAALSQAQPTAPGAKP